jgi:hypothetical protein
MPAPYTVANREFVIEDSPAQALPGNHLPALAVRPCYVVAACLGR